MLDALWTAVKLGRDYSGAVDAALAELNNGGTAFAAIDAFAAATEGKADDALVEQLKQLAQQALGYAQTATLALQSGIVRAEDFGAVLVKLQLRLEALGAADRRS